MRKDYRQDLERAARQMILVRNVDTLSKLIIRTILRKIGVKHAGLFLFDKKKNEYIVMVSRGDAEVKIPVGFTKVKKTNPMVRFFTEPELAVCKRDFLLYDRINYNLRKYKAEKQQLVVRFLEDLKDELDLYQAKALVPGFYRKDLVAVFFLGAKKDKTSFMPEELGFLSVLASDVVMAIQNAWYFEDLNAQLLANKQLFLNMVSAMARAIEAKDKYTIGHAERVVKCALCIARHVKDERIDKEFEERIRIAALLHDIGKIGVPEKVLNKEGPLDAEEFQIISKHPDIGANMISHIGQFKDVVLGVKYHHERYDGRGYPYKISGENIPLIASIIAVADTFDAMTSDRPYRRALPLEKAVDEIKLNSGKQFNPEIVAAFVKAWEEERKEFRFFTNAAEQAKTGTEYTQAGPPQSLEIIG
jgi:HD-GYP domain-containing protein (c-di-GMP phosphodiesterase class II)